MPRWWWRSICSQTAGPPRWLDLGRAGHCAVCSDHGGGRQAVPDHREFSASLLLNFRIASFGIHLVLWTVLGVVFGWLAQGPVLVPRKRHTARLQS
ncbi:CbtA family protein [Pseudomonas mosselii]|uniref:CbtA family protein n=1 Tax=Pseudomonas mosselii TaxID=78327 RepID=UPI0027DB7203|nr:CbtA family protein [Pseudomonas mosselii]